MSRGKKIKIPWIYEDYILIKGGRHKKRKKEKEQGEGGKGEELSK